MYISCTGSLEPIRKSQETWGTRQGTQSHTLQFRDANQPTMYAFGLEEEVRT